MILDTHGLIERLKARGFSPDQAEGITESLQEINLEQLATKADLRELENRLLKWIIPLMVGQTALFAAIVEWLIA